MAGILLLAACQQEDVERFAPEAGGNEFTLTMQSDRMLPTPVTTKASDPKEDAEKEIRQLYLFFFDENGRYLETYHGRFIGFQKPAEGQATVKIDRNAINEVAGGNKSVTVYVVANVEPWIFNDEDGNDKPDLFEGGDGKSPLRQLQEYVYSPSSLFLGLPANGMPMVGSAEVDFTDMDVNNASIDLKALMARVDVNITLDSDVGEGNLPAFFLADWTVENVPKQVAFTAPEEGEFTGKLAEKLEVGEQPYGGTSIYNRNGEISLSFYMFENIQDKQVGFTYPAEIEEYQKQRYKPKFAKKDATAVKLHAYYTTYNNFTYEVTYTLYLGANHTDDFKVKRNHQYKNDITIKGIVAHNGNNAGAAGEYTLDARVNVLEEGNDFYISILRERNHDAHFCVTPMDVYFFHEGNNPTVEVILDEAATEWIGMERIPAENMEAGTVPDATKQDATGQWTAGNGKRKYFTKSLVSDLKRANGGKVTVKSNRDRIYFYIDENLKLEDREATVTLIYKEGGTEKRRRTLTLGQTHLLPVDVYKEKENWWGDVTYEYVHTIYMEAYEEYLNHYDPLDKFQSEQIYDGLPWAVQGTSLANMEIPTLYRGTIDSYENPKDIYYDGFAYTGFILYRAGQLVSDLNTPPVSAFQYCFNKNKRNEDGSLDLEYRERYVGSDWKEESNESKWFLPGITQMEYALEKYFTSFREFQENFYWSSSAAKEGTNGRYQDSDRARATRVKQDGTHVSSNEDGTYSGPNGDSGNALRTEILRIRAFRIDLNE